MGQELRSWERLKPTEHCSSYQMAVRRRTFAIRRIIPNLADLRNGHDRIKEEIGTTRVNSSVGLDCRLERLEPTSVIALLSDGCKKGEQGSDNAQLGSRTELRNIDRIKHCIGTTRVNSSVGLDCRLERLEPTSVIALLSDGCKKAVPPIKHRVAIMSNLADERT